MILRRIFGNLEYPYISLYIYIYICMKYVNVHNGKLHNLYSSPDIRWIKSRRMKWAGHVACMGEGRKEYRVLVGRPKGKRPLLRLRLRWEDVIRLDLREKGWSVCVCVEWIHLAQDRDR
jgi:hypothetical protein